MSGGHRLAADAPDYQALDLVNAVMSAELAALLSIACMGYFLLTHLRA